MNKSRPIKQALIIIIALLHIITTVDLALNWSIVRSVFIDHGQSFWAMYLFYTQPDSWIALVTGIISTVATILADITIVCIAWLSLYEAHLDGRFGAVGWSAVSNG